MNVEGSEGSGSAVPFVRRQVMAYEENTVAALKWYLFVQGRLASPHDMLDIVIVEDLDHYLALLTTAN